MGVFVRKKRYRVSRRQRQALLPSPSLPSWQLNHSVIYRDADTKRSYSYAQVKSTAIDFGKGLKANWDWQKGDVLALFTPNCVDTPAITWGCHWAGGILSPANPAYTANELAFQLKDAGAKAVVTQKPFLSVVRQAAKNVGLPENRIILMGDARDETHTFKHFTSIRNTSGATRYRRTKLNPDKDLAFLVYSSGTTGHPKGVMLSHLNIVSNILMLRAGEAGHLTWDGGRDGKGDVILAFLPFFHIYGQSCNTRLVPALTDVSLQDLPASSTKPSIQVSQPSSCPNSTLRNSARSCKTRKSPSHTSSRPWCCS